MAKAKVTEVVKDRIRSLKKAGKSHKETLKAISDEYHLTIAPSTISYIVRHPVVKKKIKKAKKPAQKRKISNKRFTGNDPVTIIEAIKALLGEANALYVENLKDIRRELIETVDRLRKAREHRGDT